MEWSQDLLCTIEFGFVTIWRTEVSNLRLERLISRSVFNGLQVSPDGKYLIVEKSVSNEPYELYRYDLKSRNLTRLTFFTDEIVSGLDMSEAIKACAF